MVASFLPQNRLWRAFWIAFIFVALAVFWTRTIIAETLQGIPIDRFWRPPTNSTSNASSIEASPEVGLVIASTLKDDTTWLKNAFPDWRKFIYVVNDPTVKSTVDVNKGREANVYLR